MFALSVGRNQRDRHKSGNPETQMRQSGPNQSKNAAEFPNRFRHHQTKEKIGNRLAFHRIITHIHTPIPTVTSIGLIRQADTSR